MLMYKRAVSVDDEMRLKNFALFVCEGHPLPGRIILIKCLVIPSVKNFFKQHLSPSPLLHQCLKHDRELGKGGDDYLLLFMSSPERKSANMACGSWRKPAAPRAAIVIY